MEIARFPFDEDHLNQLLEGADRGRWPPRDDSNAWLVLANWAFQTDCLMTDEAENTAWEELMRALMRRNLQYLAFVDARMEALDQRLRSRKLQQTNLRYRYGFKTGRRPQLVRLEVQRLYRRWVES